MRPKTYESTVWLRPVAFQTGQTGQDMVAVLSSTDTFHALAMALKGDQWLDQKGKNIASNKLQNSIKVNFNAKQNYIEIVVSAETPEQARSLCVSFIEVAQEIMKPKGFLAEQLQEKIKLDRKSLEDIKAMGQLQIQTSKITNKQSEGGSSKEISYLLLKQIEIEERLLQLNYQLKGVGSEIILQQPSLPARPVGSKKFQITIIAAAMSMLFFLFIAFIRTSIKSLNEDPESAAKLARIRHSLGIPKFLS
jgi:uncharacterized protein involved in exopolysaccharide biosynthesis